MRLSYLIVMGLIIVSFAVGILTYPTIPDEVASRWNTENEVDGYMHKFWALFLLPIIMVVVIALLVFLPKIDPLHKNVKRFQKEFDLFIIVLSFFLFYIYMLTIMWNTGYSFDMGSAIAPAFAVLIFVAGVLMGKAKRNWFIGIRTPWTMNSDKVWDETHKLGAKLFKTAAIITLIGVLFPDYLVWLLVAPLILAVVVTLVYSYVVYRK